MDLAPLNCVRTECGFAFRSSRSTALLENPGEVITREDLIRRLWRDGTVVDFDRGLNAAVTRLRQALSDSAEAPRFVETVVRRGYRFLAPVEMFREATPPQQSPAVQPIADRKWILPAAIGVVLAIAITGWFLTRTMTTAVETPFRVRPLTTDCRRSTRAKDFVNAPNTCSALGRVGVASPTLDPVVDGRVKHR